MIISISVLLFICISAFLFLRKRSVSPEELGQHNKIQEQVERITEKMRVLSEKSKASFEDWGAANEALIEASIEFYNGTQLTQEQRFEATQKFLQIFENKLYDFEISNDHEALLSAYLNAVKVYKFK